jgi:hypothetical protein
MLGANLPSALRSRLLVGADLRAEEGGAIAQLGAGRTWPERCGVRAPARAAVVHCTRQAPQHHRGRRTQERTTSCRYMYSYTSVSMRIVYTSLASLRPAHRGLLARSLPLPPDLDPPCRQ